LEKPWRLL
jgi:hypothetical protein